MLINSTVHYSVKIWISQYQNGKQSRILIQQEMVEVVDWWWCKLELLRYAKLQSDPPPPEYQQSVALSANHLIINQSINL